MWSWIKVWDISGWKTSAFNPNLNKVEKRNPNLHCSSLSDLQREENPEQAHPACAEPKSESTRRWHQELLPALLGPGSSSAQAPFLPLCRHLFDIWVGKPCKEKIQEHEKSAVGAHMLLLLQHMRHLQGSLCPKGFSPRPELSLRSAGKSICELQIPAEPELDCFPASSVPGDESVLQQLMREKVISELENKLQVFENIVAVLNKEVESSHLEILAFRRQSELDQNIIRGLELKLHQCLMQKDAGLSSLHKSLLFSEQASYDGIFLWKITEVGRKLQDSVTGRTVSLYSPAFYTAKYGYKVCLRVYLNGDGTGKGTHMSLFFVVMKGDYDALLPWPFRHKVTFMLLDQNNREHIIDAFRPDLTSASFQRPVNEMNVASGCPLFLPLAKLQSPKHAYVREDTLFLKCIIETN
uniref:TNF receptor-associated factor 1 n=1 Tax=Junco hyemalis TaxID=40217 RepID=A0A8C5NK78_JUNHY